MSVHDRNMHINCIHKVDLTNSIISILAALDNSCHKVPLEIHIFDFNDKQFLIPKSNHAGSYN